MAEPTLFLIEEAWREHWVGMPEFLQEDLEPWRTVYVHFASRTDMQRFAELVGQNLLPTTRQIWFPPTEIVTYADKRYADES